MDAFTFYHYVFDNILNILNTPINLGVVTVSLFSVMLGTMLFGLLVWFIRKLYF